MRGQGRGAGVGPRVGGTEGEVGLRSVVQRVSSAKVLVGNEVVAEMGTGLLALVGVARGDEPADAELLATKLAHLRVFPDASSRMNRSLLDTGGTLALVSQFTLLGDTRKGRRPSYVEAAVPEVARRLFESVVEVASGYGLEVVTGRFAADMQVSLVNDGPVTLWVDTRSVY